MRQCLRDFITCSSDTDKVILSGMSDTESSGGPSTPIELTAVILVLIMMLCGVHFNSLFMVVHNIQ